MTEQFINTLQSVCARINDGAQQGNISWSVAQLTDKRRGFESHVLGICRASDLINNHARKASPITDSVSRQVVMIKPLKFTALKPMPPLDPMDRMVGDKSIRQCLELFEKAQRGDLKIGTKVTPKFKPDIIMTVEQMDAARGAWADKLSNLQKATREKERCQVVVDIQDYDY